MTLEAVKGLIPKHDPPAKTLRLCEEILDELRKAEEQTAAGGTRAVRNAKRAASGEGNEKTCDVMLSKRRESRVDEAKATTKDERKG